MAGLDYGTRDMMIRTIWGEARSEGPTGQAAVASVIFNRQYSGLYPNTAEGVMLQPGQFSVWNFQNGYAGGAQGNSSILSLSPNSEAYRNIGNVVDGVASGSIADPTGGSLNYYNPNVSSPNWGLGSSGWTSGPTIGGHLFGTANGQSPYDFSNTSDIRTGGGLFNNAETVGVGGRDVGQDWQSSPWGNAGVTGTPFYGDPFARQPLPESVGSMTDQHYSSSAGIWNDPIEIQPSGSNAELTGSQPMSSAGYGWDRPLGTGEFGSNAYQYSSPSAPGEATATGQFRDPYFLGRGETGVLEGSGVGQPATAAQISGEGGGSVGGEAGGSPGGETAAAPSTPSEAIAGTQSTGAQQAGSVQAGTQGTPGSIPQAIVTGDNQVATATANAGKAQAQAIQTAAKQASQTDQTIAAQGTSTVYNVFLRIMIFIVGAIFLGAGLYVLGRGQIQQV